MKHAMAALALCLITLAGGEAGAEVWEFGSARRPGRSSTPACSYMEASIYFENPTPMLEKYMDAQYYCWEILYLEREGKGAITTEEYKALYPAEAHGKLAELRTMGITPDIIEAHMDEDTLETLSSSDLDVFAKSHAEFVRGSADYVVASMMELEDEAYRTFADRPGPILDKENLRACIKDEYRPATEAAPERANRTPSYYEVMDALPMALRPVAMNGYDLVNMFGDKVGEVVFDETLTTGAGKAALKETIREVRLNPDIFMRRHIRAHITWNDKACHPNSIEYMVERHSVCRLCPFVVMVFNQISYLFGYMYDTFRWIIVSFLILFGCFAFATTFFKGFSEYPFAINFSNYYGEIGERTRLVFLASIIAVVPPKTIFEFSVQPVIDLTLAVSYEVLNAAGEMDKCDGAAAVDDANENRLALQESEGFADNKIVPPIVRAAQIKNMEKLEESYVMSKETVGNIVCFMSNMVRSNAKHMMMGEVLMRSTFDITTKNEHRILSLIYGLVIFGLFAMINLLMSFYILDAFISILKIAILWPFMVFGYAFKFIRFDVREIVNTAKDFGFTMIALSVFALFNTIMIQGFYFGQGDYTMINILDKAAALNSKRVIIEAVPADVVSMSKFLFIVFAVYYIYARLSQFTSSYSGGGMDPNGRKIGEAIKTLVGSSIAVFTGVGRDKVSAASKKGGKPAPKEEKKPGPEEEETTAEESAEVRSNDGGS